MTDKMPTNIWAGRDTKGTYWLDHEYSVPQYTLVHNNPDYHIIPKADVDGDKKIIVYYNDEQLNGLICVFGSSVHYIKSEQLPDYNVDGDVMGAFEHLVDCLDGCMAEHELNLIRNALIAQSAPISPRGENGMVTIPISLANDIMGCLESYNSIQWNEGCEGDNYSDTISEFEQVLNYKEGE
jgi:hypothetical protein